MIFTMPLPDTRFLKPFNRQILYRPAPLHVIVNAISKWRKVTQTRLVLDDRTPCGHKDTSKDRWENEGGSFHQA